MSERWKISCAKFVVAGLYALLSTARRLVDRIQLQVGLYEELELGHARNLSPARCLAGRIQLQVGLYENVGLDHVRNQRLVGIQCRRCS